MLLKVSDLSSTLDGEGLLPPALKDAYLFDQETVTYGLLASFVGSLVLAVYLVVKHMATLSVQAVHYERERTRLERDRSKMEAQVEWEREVMEVERAAQARHIPKTPRPARSSHYAPHVPPTAAQAAEMAALVEKQKATAEECDLLKAGLAEEVITPPRPSQTVATPGPAHATHPHPSAPLLR